MQGSLTAATCLCTHLFLGVSKATATTDLPNSIQAWISWFKRSTFFKKEMRCKSFPSLSTCHRSWCWKTEHRGNKIRCLRFLLHDLCGLTFALLDSKQRGFYNSVSPFPKLTIVCTLFFCCCSQNETPHDIYIHYSNAYFPSPRLPKESYVAADYRTMKFTRTFCLFLAFKDFWGLATGSLKCHPT